MKSGKWYSIPFLSLIIALGATLSTGCKKFDNYENNYAIQTPYGVYFADKLGTVYNTNDGKAYNIVFPADGVPCRALATSGTNFMFLKYNRLINANATLFLSENNGVNFNPVFRDALPDITWQNQILNVPAAGNRIYLASPIGSTVEFSQDNGKTWEDDATFTALSGFTIQSLTQTKNGSLYAFDYKTLRLFEQISIGQGWTEKFAVNALPNGKFQIDHFNNTLVAADFDGTNGVWYSNDFGVNWTQFNGLPTNHRIFFATSAHDKVLLAGTDSLGIYRLIGDTFVPSNNGIATQTSVYSIASKEEIYKNQNVKQYIYIAASTGLYRSEDLGQNWVLMRSGDYRNVY
ncbi:MAG: hypothetical protein ABI378_11615 [Chitinophagaceae bacterium]